MSNLDLSYNVHMDYNGLREMVRAQNVRYTRKAGIACLVFLLPLYCFIYMIVSINGFMTALIEEWYFFAMAGGLSVFPVIMISGKGMTILSTIGPSVRKWFALHGTDTTDQINVKTFFLDTGLKDLRCDYTIHLSDYGFIEESQTARLVQPWFVMDGYCVKRKWGMYFTHDNGREDSVLYNAIGDNALFRETGIDGVLFVPKQILEENPDLKERILECIGRTAKYKDRSLEEIKQNDPAFGAWLSENEHVNEIAE